ncbi:MAG: hypothetical protein Q9162_003410 [Coniocarpon cinnabarinum]
MPRKAQAAVPQTPTRRSTRIAGKETPQSQATTPVVQPQARSPPPFTPHHTPGAKPEYQVQVRVPGPSAATLAQASNSPISTYSTSKSSSRTSRPPSTQSVSTDLDAWSSAAESSQNAQRLLEAHENMHENRRRLQREPEGESEKRGRGRPRRLSRNATDDVNDSAASSSASALIGDPKKRTSRSRSRLRRSAQRATDALDTDALADELAADELAHPSSSRHQVRSVRDAALRRAFHWTPRPSSSHNPFQSSSALANRPRWSPKDIQSNHIQPTTRPHDTIPPQPDRPRHQAHLRPDPTRHASLPWNPNTANPPNQHPPEVTTWRTHVNRLIIGTLQGLLIAGFITGSVLFFQFISDRLGWCSIDTAERMNYGFVMVVLMTGVWLGWW